MGLYVINIGDASAKQWVQFSYEHTLNGMSNCQIGLDGVTGGYVAEFDVDKDIYIYKGGVLKFRGVTTEQASMSGGGIVLYALGIEKELTDSKSPMVGSLTTRAWAATSDHTILSVLVTSVSGWTIDTSNSTGENVDFRTSATESVWNAVINLISQTGKDIWIDQTNKKVYLYDEYTRDDKFSFIEGKNATNIVRNKSGSKAAKVIIYGKGDGANQIIGSTGSGVPVYSYIDRNILSTTEANKRALVEYNKLNPQLKSYSLTPTEQIDSLQIGDMGNIANNSASINEEVDIVRMKTTVSKQGIEDIMIEVTNPELRIASKNVAEERAKSSAGYIQSQTSMQGNGNVLTWDLGINAHSTAPLRIPFYVSPTLCQDEAGNIRVNSLTLDYDIDPYRKGVGTASETEVAPDFDASSAADSHKHDAADSGHPHGNNDQATNSKTISLTAGSDSQTRTINGWYNNALTVALTSLGGLTIDFLKVYVRMDANFSGTPDIGCRIGIDGSYYARRLFLPADTSWSSILIQEWFLVPKNGVIAWSALTVDFYSSFSASYDVYVIVQYEAAHYHTTTSWNSNSANAAVSDANKTPGVSGFAELHDHNVSIGDGTSEAGAVNATEVNIYLDYWNGSAWINKHSVLTTSKTLDYDVDITDGGTYPDATGYWQVRMYTDSASADYAQGIVKLKHAMDN